MGKHKWVGCGCDEHNWPTHYHTDSDSYFCPDCDVWMDETCDDIDCQECLERPEKPSMIGDIQGNTKRVLTNKSKDDTIYLVVMGTQSVYPTGKFTTIDYKAADEGSIGLVCIRDGEVFNYQDHTWVQREKA